ncbi:MAG: S8/S53 family peptidase, partial [Candidatus Paceibacterota bacterium]
MSTIKKTLVIVLAIIAIIVASLFIARPCPRYHVSQLYLNPQDVPLSQKVLNWYVDKFCPESAPVSRLIKEALAQSIGSDLVNLRSNFPDLVGAYEKISILDAWEKINELKPVLEKTTIGIVDTGVDATNGRHPEFDGVDFGTNDHLSLQDRSSKVPGGRPAGHGTEIAGIIGANNIIGTGGTLIGDSPQMNGLISGVSGLKYTLESRALNLITMANLGSTIDTLPTGSVVNMSFKKTDCRFLVLFCIKGEEFNEATRYFRQAFEGNSDKLFVVAAGNDGLDVEKSVPSNITLSNTIIVAATDLNDERADFGIFGGSSSFGVGVNISAPGIGVYAPAIRGKGNFPTSGAEANNY